MPCDSSYQEPTRAELESKRVLALLVYVKTALGLRVSQTLTAAASATYGRPSKLDADTAELCQIIREMTQEEQDKVMYDGRNANARKLADWWDAHKEHDRKNNR